MASEAGSLFSGPARWPAPYSTSTRRTGRPPCPRIPSRPCTGFYWLTVNLAERQPIAILVDDAHWADRGSLRFLGYLARRLGGLRAALIVTARPVVERSSDGSVQGLAADGGILFEPQTSE